MYRNSPSPLVIAFVMFVLIGVLVMNVSISVMKLLFYIRMVFGGSS
jgi:hypothetical protein